MKRAGATGIVRVDAVTKPTQEVHMTQVTQAARRETPRPGAQSEISFRLSGRNASAQVPLTLWTDFVVDGERIFIRTSRPVPLLEELCGSAARQGSDLPDIEVRTVTDGEPARGAG
jgi:hypothetical protein